MAGSIRVAVVGAGGRMGREAMKAIAGDPTMSLVAAVGRSDVGKSIRDLAPNLSDLPDLVVQADVASALDSSAAGVLLDLSHHSIVLPNAEAAFERGCAPVIGATGLSPATLEGLRALSASTGVPALFAPNFAVGAVLMMRFSEMASRWYGDAEIIEMHHERKEDAPSGTALHTAELIGKARTMEPSWKPAPAVKVEGVLGGRWHGVPIHSIRLPGLLAHQQVMFGASGESLTLRHDSTDRAGFMHGICLAIREVRSLNGFVIGLDKLLFAEA